MKVPNFRLYSHLYGVLLFPVLIGVSAFSKPVNPGADSQKDRKTVHQLLDQLHEAAVEFRAVDLERSRTEAHANQAAAWDNPEFSWTGGPMTQGSLGGNSLDLAFRQPLPVSGRKGVEGSLARKTGHARESVALAQARDLEVELFNLALRGALLEEEQSHVSHRRENMKKISRFLSSRPMASPSQRAEEAVLLARLREIEEEFLETESALAATAERMKTLLKVPTSVRVDFDWESQPKLESLDQLMASAQERNPLLRAQRSTKEASADQLRLAEKKVYPDLRVGFAYNEQNAELPQQIRAGVVELTVPLLNIGAAERQAARAQHEIEGLREERLARELGVQVRVAWLELERHRKRLELYPFKMVTEGEKRAREGAESWGRGQISTPVFLELEEKMHSHVVKYFSSRAEVWSTWARLQVLVGRSVRESF